MLAESVSQPLPGEDPDRQNREALEILESARRLGGITPAFLLRRATALERSGDRQGAGAERKLAEEVPASAWSAVDHFLTGEQAYRQKDLKLAIESFRHSLSIQPDRFWAQYFLAVCHLKEHRPAEALAALIACQSRRPGFAWAYLLKGFAEGEMREFDLAEEDFRRANELRLNDQERYVMLVNRGVMRIRRGRHADAAADLSGAIALKPDQFEAYINLAMAFRNLGRWDEALATLDRAIDGHPSEAVLYRARSQVYRLRSRTDEALDDLRRVIALLPPDDPASAADFLEIALILQQTGRSEESLVACDRALRLKPNRPEIHRARGAALMMLGRYDEAVRSFDACHARGGASAALYEARGLALTSHGSYERALADYTLALSMGRATPSLLANRGWVYLLSGAPAPALRDFDESVRLDPTNSHALSGRALTNVQLRKTREAIADARASILLSPDDARQVYNAARVFCQAAACLESSAEKNGTTMATADRYRSEALRLLARAVDLCPEADRSRFWDDFVRKDASLDPIRRSRSFIDLGARATAGRSLGRSRSREQGHDSFRLSAPDASATRAGRARRRRAVASFRPIDRMVARVRSAREPMRHERSRGLRGRGRQPADRPDRPGVGEYYPGRRPRVLPGDGGRRWLAGRGRPCFGVRYAHVPPQRRWRRLDPERGDLADEPGQPDCPAPDGRHLLPLRVRARPGSGISSWPRRLPRRHSRTRRSARAPARYR